MSEEVQRKDLTIKYEELIDEINKKVFMQISDSLKEKLHNLQIVGIVDIVAPEIFHSLKEILNDSGNLILIFDENFKNEDNQVMKVVSNMKFAGYINTKIENNANMFQITGQKRKSNKKGNDNPWKNINLEVKSDLVLEDELDDPFNSYQKFAKKSDCITKPKPCKNCNCGRAEKEKSAENSNVNVTSSCGRCYLGDAFRCAGCPYKGIPAFEPGEKIDFTNINTNNNQQEMQIESEDIKVKLNTGDNKIKLDI